MRLVGPALQKFSRLVLLFGTEIERGKNCMEEIESLAMVLGHRHSSF